MLHSHLQSAGEGGNIFLRHILNPSGIKFNVQLSGSVDSIKKALFIYNFSLTWSFGVYQKPLAFSLEAFNNWFYKFFKFRIFSSSQNLFYVSTKTTFEVPSRSLQNPHFKSFRNLFKIYFWSHFPFISNPLQRLDVMDVLRSIKNVFQNSFKSFKNIHP